MHLEVLVVWLINGIVIAKGTWLIIFGPQEAWQDPRTRFQVVVLWPLLANSAGGVIASAITKNWTYAAFFVADLLLVGAIGAGLHPMLVYSDLARGPITSVAANTERSTLPFPVKLLLNRRASVLVALLLVANLSALLIHSGWPWYSAMPVSFAVSSLLGGVLVYVFATGHGEVRGTL